MPNRRGAIALERALAYMDLRPGRYARRTSARARLHRFVHERAARRPARSGAASARCARRAGRARDRRAGFERGQTAGGSARVRCGLSRSGVRVARIGLLDVLGRKCRFRLAGRALRVDEQPQFRRPARTRRAHALGESAHRRGVGARRLFRRRADGLTWSRFARLRESPRRCSSTTSTPTKSHRRRCTRAGSTRITVRCSSPANACVPTAARIRPSCSIAAPTGTRAFSLPERGSAAEARARARSGR